MEEETATKEDLTPDETLNLINARRLKALLLRKELIAKSNGMAVYVPHPKQDLFHRAGGYKRRYIRTGNRFGKSLLGTAEDCAWAVGERVWYDVDDPARTVGIPKRSTTGLIIVQDWGQAEKVFTSQENGQNKGKLFKMLPESSIVKIEKNQAGDICKLIVKSIHGGESSISIDTIKSFKANPQAHESSDWDWIHIDEPCPEDMWKAVSRGLIDRGGSAWFTCTPLIEMWINDLFVAKGLSRHFFDKPMVSADGNYWILDGSMHDNPTLKAEDKQIFISTLSKSEIAARVNGRPMSLDGQIYKEFDPDESMYEGVPHGWEDHDIPPMSWTIRAAIDTHGSVNSNQAVLMCATSPHGFTYFFSEIYEAMLIPELCGLMTHKLHGRELFQAELEQGAYIQHPSRGDCMADDFIKAGFNVSPASKELARGILKTQEALKKRCPKTGERMMKFSPTLTEFLFEVDRYVWDANGKPRDKQDHMMENLYRLVLTGLEWIKPNEYEGRVMKPVSVTQMNFELPKLGLTRGTDLMTLPRKFNKRDRYRK